MLPKVRFRFRFRFGSRLSPRTALRALRRRFPRPSRRLAVSSTLFPVAVLVALALAKGGPAEGQRAPVTATPGAAVRSTATPAPGPCADDEWLRYVNRFPPEWRPSFERVCREAHDPAFQQALDARIAARRASTPPPRPVPPGAGALTTRLIQMGIEPTPAGDGYFREDGGEPIVPNFIRNSVWWTETPTLVTAVYAGHLRDDPNQGAVVVSTIPYLNGDPTGVDITKTRFDAPAPTGVLRVVGATGRRIHLLAKSGVTFTFDLDTRTFSEP